MEKKVDISSPVGVLEDYFRSEESESCSSKGLTSDESAQKVSKRASCWQGFVKLLRSRSKNPIGTLHPLENLIGKDDYAKVYKGCLQNEKIVAIKRPTQGTIDEIIGDFLFEMGILAHMNHPNIAKLIGYGVEGGMHLVLELYAHGGLASCFMVSS
ncbi:unnamed protein product [Dovyalis caffra]|uniref:Protein kinase domain-containing protein n=1 Tax=Dovyalis caffra TaxID=77055 RepID=A0AAV1QPM6_9ROSI|nr:unnamed protein product [Dovyalis caffra]